MTACHRLIFALTFSWCFLFLLQSADSQTIARDTSNYPYWIEMMQNPKVNFFKTQKAFETYWKNRPVTRSSGWKPFKRWEYMMGPRVSHTGERPAPDADYQAYQNYFGNRHQTDNINGNWTERGPNILPLNGAGLGRLNAIGFHPTDPNILFVGSPSGGLWKTINGGQTWTSNTDGLPTLGVSSILVDYTQPDILYIGTGDRDAGDAPGLGVMKSTDGGQTWNMANTTMGNVTVGKMIMHPSDPLIIYAATSNGIFKTTNGANTWVLISNNNSNFKDIKFKPGDPSVIYAATDGSLVKSTDDGNTWVSLTNGLPGGSRGVIGVSPANPNMVYFFLCNNDSYKGMYLSMNEGQSFTEQSVDPNIMSWGCDGGTGGQAWYDQALAVDPVNPNILYAGGVNIFKSTDGGITWNITAHWYGGCGVANVHADLHVLEWSPLNGNLYAGNDGGIYVTSNQGSNWQMISRGLAIGQVYKIGQSATQKGLCMNGYQDNGTSCLADTVWRSVMGGDGMECIIDYQEEKYKYGSIYYGAIDRIYNFTDQGGIAGNGTNGINEEGAWVTPFILHETNPNTMFIGYKNVWRSNNIRSLSPSTVTWTKISTFNGSNCRVLENSSANPDILYVVKENNLLYRTDNANAAAPVWINLTNNLPANPNPSDLEAHPTNPNIVYMTSNKKVYKSLDKGNSWTDITGSLPNVFASCITYCKGSQEGLYLGTDIGVFYRDASMGDWIPFSSGLPATSRITELEIYYDHNNPANNLIRGCTYGRGLWESPLYESHPVAQFEANLTGVPAGCAVNFTDLSMGYPTSWEWQFPGGTPATSSNQNPQNVIYNNTGQFDVTLIVHNSQGSDTLVLPGYITISSSILPVPGFSISDSTFCSGTAIATLTDTSSFCPLTWQWVVTPPTITFLNGTNANSPAPVIQFNQDGTYSISLTVGNVNGNIMVNHPSMVHVGGIPVPFSDDFEGGPITHKGWTIENPNNDKTWDLAITGGNPPGNKSARMFIFGTNTLNRRDRLITPPLDLTGQPQAILNFMHSYAQYQLDYTDSLIVYASENCGLTWNRLYSGGDNGTGNFATHPPQTFGFVPEVENDWCGGTYGSPCISLDFSYYAGKKNVKVAFESVSGLSNNIYLDNVYIDIFTSSNSQVSTDRKIEIFPNPSNGIFNILANQEEEISGLSVFNTFGQVVYTNNHLHSSGKSIRVDISDQPSGIYYLQAKTSKRTLNIKLLVQ